MIVIRILCEGVCYEGNIHFSHWFKADLVVKVEMHGSYYHQFKGDVKGAD